MLNVASLSDIGLVRSHNEDACDSGLLENGAWAVVCDGMGGAKGGEIASRTAVSKISEQLKEGYRGDRSDNSIKYLMNSMIYNANAQIYDMAQSMQGLSGMGTTVVLAVVIHGIAHIAHAGDSRAYLITQDEMQQLTLDHSMVQELVRMGDLTPEEAKVHPQKNIITRALGVHAILDIDYCEYRMPENSRLLLCSDGLTNYVEPDRIHQLSKELTLEELPQRLIQLAKDGGGGDNITVAVIENEPSERSRHTYG